MLKNYRLIALVFGLAVTTYISHAQNENYKDVLLNGKPAKLNLVTGEVTYINGEIAKNRAAKRLQDSLLATRTVIQSNLLVDIPESSQQDESKVDIAATPNSNEPSTISIAENTFEENKETNTEKTEVTDASVTVISKSTETDVVPENNEDALERSETDIIHTVIKDETLYSLSKRYNTTVSDILIANNLRSTVIKVGQKLQIPDPDSQEAREILWVVSRGETLSEIARRNNTTISSIKQLNDLTSDLIKIGQRLQIQQNSETAKK